MEFSIPTGAGPHEFQTRINQQDEVLAADDALALGLSLTDSPPVDAAEPGLLTPRQLEVAELLSQGLSNRQIAERLVVTERTVASHIEHILDKLNLSSRTQIALWAARPPGPA